MVIDQVSVDVSRPVDRRSERALPYGCAIVGIESETWFAIVASSARSRVRPSGSRTPATINGCASAPRRSPANGKENSRLMPDR